MRHGKIGMKKFKSKLTLVIVAAGVSFWVLDIIIDEYFFSKRPIYDGLIFNVPSHEIYMNLTTILAIFAFGLLTIRYATRLNESEGRYRQLFDNIEDALFLLSFETTGGPGKFIEVNPAGIRSLGYTKEELRQLSLAQLTLPQKFQDLASIMNQPQADRRVLFEAVQVAKDGRRIPVEIKAHLFELEGTARVLAIARDITERKQAEDKIRQVQAELEKRVQERTAELSRANRDLKLEIAERQQAEQALRESENELHLLTAQLLSAEERERRRISSELHDELGQALTLLKFQIITLVDKQAKNGAGLKNESKVLIEHVDEIIENVRRLARDLSPAVLEEMGLSSALRYLLEEFQEYHSTISYREDVDEIDTAFSQPTQISIYRIFQESLTNIYKHSRATQISVAAKKLDGQVAFAVQDNGQGFDVARVLAEGSAEGLGLAAMQERVRMIGGVLEVWSRAGQGTRISFTIPIEESSTDESTLPHRPGR